MTDGRRKLLILLDLIDLQGATHGSRVLDSGAVEAVLKQCEAKVRCYGELNLIAS